MKLPGIIRKQLGQKRGPDTLLTEGNPRIVVLKNAFAITVGNVLYDKIHLEGDDRAKSFILLHTIIDDVLVHTDGTFDSLSQQEIEDGIEMLKSLNNPKKGTQENVELPSIISRIQQEVTVSLERLGLEMVTEGGASKVIYPLFPKILRKLQSSS